MLSKNGVVSTISTDLLSHEAIGFPLVSLISARYKTLEIILFSWCYSNLVYFPYSQPIYCPTKQLVF